MTTNTDIGHTGPAWEAAFASPEYQAVVAENAAIDALIPLVDAAWPAAADSFLAGSTHVAAEDTVMIALSTIENLIGAVGLARCGARYVLMLAALSAKSDCDQSLARQYAGWVRLQRASTAPGPWITHPGQHVVA